MQRRIIQAFRTFQVDWGGPRTGELANPNNNPDAACWNSFHSFQSTGWIASRLLACLLSLFLITTGLNPTYAQTPSIGGKWGYVMTRTVVRDENGQPFIVEYDEQGKEIREVPLPGPYQNARDQLLILQAEEYRFHKQRLDQFKETYEETLAADARLLTVPAFMGDTYPTADKSTQIAPQQPPEHVKSVLVRGQSNRILDDPASLILLSFPLDLANDNVPVGDNARSIVVSPDGQILYASDNTIGYRTGFFGDPNEPQDSTFRLRVEDPDTIFGPVAGARVFVPEVYPGGADGSDNSGRYSMTYLLPTCPLGGFEYMTDLFVELRYKNFMPQGAPSIPYYLRSQAWDYCYASLTPSGTLGPPVYTSNGGGSIVNLNMYVDVMFVSGHIKLVNAAGEAVPLGNTTTFKAFDEEEEDTLTEVYDFNGDGQNDHVEKGAILNQRKVGDNCTSILDEQGQVIEVFVRESQFCNTDTEADMQGVWFETQNEFPDLVRIMDKEKRIEDIGLLDTISAEDYKNTDILIFREATGQLVMERRGLPSEEIEGSREAVAYDEDEERVAYRVMLRGPKDRDLNIGGASRAGGFEQWAARSYLTEPFSKREANHLKPGEYIEIVAINRSTGYIGTQRVQLKSAADNGGALGIGAKTITMRPPNLKIWAEREYNVEHGLTSGENSDRLYTVGAEGASLTSDTTVTIYTEWLDHDGSALPEGLGDDNGEQYGLTGRLAKVVSDGGSLQAVAQSDLADFPIAPGRKTQALQVASNQSFAEHFYVHVIGKPKDQECGDVCPNFTDTGAVLGAAPPYDTRPRFLTPFYVPLFDEEQHWEEYNAYRELQRNYNPDNTNGGVKPLKPLPAYAWKYRPEYQFSRFQLEMRAVNRVQEDEESNETKIDVLRADNPIISDSDDFVEALYSLIGSEFERLTPIDGEQQLVLALGEHEQLIELGENRTIRFDNIEHLARLDVEDYLSMRLYTNNDAGNILWEWAFLGLSVGVVSQDKIVGDDVVYISADEPTVDLGAVLIGYSALSPEKIAELPEQVKWSVVSGNASIEPAISDLSRSGVAETTVKLSPQARNTVVVKAELLGDESASDLSVALEVIPGTPAVISPLTTSGAAYVKGVGEAEVTATIRDQHGNLVISGTPVEFREQGHINLKSYTAFANKGTVSAVVTGGGVAGSYPLALNVGTLSQSTDVSVLPLHIEFIGLPDTLIAGQKYDLQARISGGTGLLENIFVDLGSDAGLITAMDTVTDSQGIVNFTYKAPLAPGNYNLGVKLDINSPHIQPIEVVRPTGQNKLNAQQYYLVSGAQNMSGMALTNFRGEAGTLSLPDSNALVLAGNEGDAWTLEFDTAHFLNSDPVYFSRFSSVRWDELRKYDSNFNGVSRSDSSIDGIYSLAFNSINGEEATWNLLHSEDFEIAEPSYNFWFEPRESGKVLNVAKGSITLEYSGGTLTAGIRTAESFVEQAIQGITDNEWIAVAVGVRNGIFYFAVDEQMVTTPLNGAIDYGTVANDDIWLTLGGGAEGRIAGLRIYDNQRPSLIALGSTSGTFDPTGEQHVNISVTPAYTQSAVAIPGVTVAIHRASGETTKINVLNGRIARRLASNYFDINAESSVNMDSVMRTMPMTENFPDPRMAVSSLSQRMVLRGNQEVAVENVIANMSWISYEPRYAALHDKVDRLKQIFADQGQLEMTLYAAEYLQEATIQANYGDPLWMRAMSTGLTVMAELAETRPEHVQLIGDAIKSRKDFWTWIRVLGLPANAWVGDSIPIPRPDMTCDKVDVEVNHGTLFEFSSTPCRANGAQMGAFIDVFLDVEPQISTNPELLTTYVATTLSSLPHTSVDFRHLFPPHNFVVAGTDRSLLIQEAHAAPVWLYAVRAMAIGIKQAIRKGAGGAPANFVAFMQGGTNSRVTRWEMLAALAYLDSRLDGTPCASGNCKKLNAQVSETVIQDTASWFAGLGLAKSGDIPDEDLLKRNCQVANNAHGKGFELLVTALYHALNEFGGTVGVANPERYEILLSDPRDRNNLIKVGIMDDGLFGGLTDYDGSPHQRKPDLILAGEDTSKRHWVELKSWKYSKDRPRYLNTDGKTLNRRIFIPWDGRNKDKAGNARGKLNFRANAHKQFFLDFVASRDTLFADHWKDKPYEDFKPAKHTTWIQVWKSGRREWRTLEKVNGKYRISEKMASINVATPWIDEDKIVSTTTPQFRALQSFLAQAPEHLKESAFQNTVGYKKSEHAKYVDKQVTHTFAEFSESDIRPFTVMTFLASEAGGSDDAKNLFKQMVSEFAGDEYGELLAAMESGELTEEMVDQLREKIVEKMQEILGPVKWLFVRIPILSDIEDAAADYVLGDEVEALRKHAAEMKLPEFLFENACEAP